MERKIKLKKNIKQDVHHQSSIYDVTSVNNICRIKLFKFKLVYIIFLFSVFIG